MTDHPLLMMEPTGLQGDVPLPGGSATAATTDGDSQTRTETPMNWFNPAMGTSGFPYTPISSSYDASQAMHPPALAKTQLQEEKPLFTWSGQNVNPTLPGAYRDHSQATPSTATSWMYSQTPRTSDSFLTAPSLTPLSGHASDSSYTGLSPAFGYLATNSASELSDQRQETIQRQRPVPIRHMTTNSVGTIPRSASYGYSMGSWPYPYSGPVPPPSSNQFTLSQPPFAARRMTNEPILYEPDAYNGSRRLHPSPGSRGHTSFRSVHYTPPGGRMGHARHASLGQEVKPPRFKPTVEQKAILIETYERNPNPDAPTREVLAKQLGPEIKPKTLQIWFQNRRSKSKTKEQAASLPKPLGGRGPGHRRSASREIDMHALKVLPRSDDPNMTLLPVTVLAFAGWRRISTPGSCNPDLGGSIHLIPPPMATVTQPFSPHLHLYVVQSGTTFRMTIHIDQDSIGPEPVHMSTNPNSDMDTVAVRLNIRPGKTIFSMWTGQSWTAALDFTEGVATLGGRCEMTGKKEIMIPAFNRLSDILSPFGPHPVVEDIPALPGGWKFPPSAGLGGSTLAEYTPTDLEHQIINPAYFDDFKPFSSGSSSHHNSSHSSTETGHSTLHEPDMTGTLTSELAFSHLPNEAPVPEEPLDFSKWAEMAFPVNFNTSTLTSAIPLAHHDLPISTGHHPAGSMSESERTQSSGTGESSVSTPVLHGLGLQYMEEPLEVVAGESSGQPMDFKWFS